MMAAPRKEPMYVLTTTVSDNCSFTYSIAEPMLELPEISSVIFRKPRTIINWADGSKTIVKIHNEDWDEEKGFAMAVCKKLYGRCGTDRIIAAAQRQEEG